MHTSRLVREFSLGWRTLQSASEIAFASRRINKVQILDRS
jgi:hypothetical protein